MSTVAGTDLCCTDPKTLRRQLRLRAQAHANTGRVLNSGELLALYEHRHRIEPSKAEAALLLASMLVEDADNLTPGTRRNELGWFWFRNCTTKEFDGLLKKLARSRIDSVALPASKLLMLSPYRKTLNPDIFNRMARHYPGYELAEAVSNSTPAKVLPQMRRVANDTSLNEDVRSSALKVIGRYKRQEDLPLLRSLAADKSARVRWGVIEALAAHEDTADAAVVRKLTADTDEHTRYKAVVTLGCFRREEDRQWLRSVAQAQRHPNRAQAVESLACFHNSEDLPLFRTLTKDADFVVRWKASLAVGRFQDPVDVEMLRKLALKQSVGPLEALMSYPPKMAAGAIRQLANKGACRCNIAGRLSSWKHPDAVKLARRFTRAKEYQVRAQAAASLGELGNAQDIPRLRHLSQWDTESVRREAVWALGGFRRAADVSFLQERAWDESPEVRTVAAMALTRVMGRTRLVHWLEAGRHLSFETMREADFVLYAPAWIKRVYPRIGNDHIRMDLGLLGKW